MEIPRRRDDDEYLSPPRFYVAFDVDLGDLAEGHHVVARGIERGQYQRRPWKAYEPDSCLHIDYVPPLESRETMPIGTRFPLGWSVSGEDDLGTEYRVMSWSSHPDEKERELGAALRLGAQVPLEAMQMTLRFKPPRGLRPPRPWVKQLVIDLEYGVLIEPAPVRPILFNQLGEAEVIGKPEDMFQRRLIRAAGVRVLDAGLPELPDEITYDTCLPVAYWQGPKFAAVQFLVYERDADEDKWLPCVRTVVYRRDDVGWTPPRSWFGTSAPIDPIGEPASLRHLGRRDIVGGVGNRRDRRSSGDDEYPEVIFHGWVSPRVSAVSVVQDGRTTRRTLDSHFGALIICLESTSLFVVEAFDEKDKVLGRIEDRA